MATPEKSTRQDFITQPNKLAELPLGRQIRQPEPRYQNEEAHTRTKVSLCQVKEIHDNWPKDEFGINFKQALFLAINDPKRSNIVSSPEVLLKIKETVSEIYESLNKSPQVLLTYNWVTDFNYEILRKADQPSSCLKHNILKQISSGFSGLDKTEQRLLIANTIFSKNLNAESAKALISYLERIDKKSDLNILQSSIDSFFRETPTKTKKEVRIPKRKHGPRRTPKSVSPIEKLPESTPKVISDPVYEQCKEILSVISMYEGSKFFKKDIPVIAAIKHIHPIEKKGTLKPKKLTDNQYIEFKEKTIQMLSQAGIQNPEKIDMKVVRCMVKINPELVHLIRENLSKGYVTLNTAISIVYRYFGKENFSIQKLMFEWFKDQPSAQSHADKIVEDCKNKSTLTPKTNDDVQRGLINMTFVEYCQLNKIPIEKTDFTRLDQKMAQEKQKENIAPPIATVEQNPTSPAKKAEIPKIPPTEVKVDVVKETQSTSITKAPKKENPLPSEAEKNQDADYWKGKYTKLYNNLKSLSSENKSLKSKETPSQIEKWWDDPKYRFSSIEKKIIDCFIFHPEIDMFNNPKIVDCLNSNELNKYWNSIKEKRRIVAMEHK